MSGAGEECGNCRFWLKRNDSAGEMGGGYCRRFPPFFPSGLRLWKTTATMADIEATGNALNDAWPNVHKQSWCGEFRPAERKDDLPW